MMFSAFSDEISVLEVQIFTKHCFQHFLVKSLCLGLPQFHARIDFPPPGTPPPSDIPRIMSPLWANPSCILNLGFKAAKPFVLSLFTLILPHSVHPLTPYPHFTFSTPFLFIFFPPRPPKSLGSRIPKPAIPHRTLRHLLLIRAPSS